MDPVYPFRWDVTKRTQLGSLIEDLEPNHDTWLEKEMYSTERRASRTIDDEPPLWLKRELLRCSAKIIALSDNSDLFFVGRSLDSIFDYLSGLLQDTSWANRLSLLHFSMSRTDKRRVERDYPNAIAKLRSYLSYANLEPSQLIKRARPVTFVDIVASGETFGNLVGLLHSWCKEIRGDWPSVQRKIRIIGLPKRGQTSPKTWRWWQHAEWVELLDSDAIKNVSIPAGLFEYVGAAQSKISVSYTPWRWGDPRVLRPSYDQDTRLALRMAVYLFDEGKQKEVKRVFAGELSKLPAMEYAWFRELTQELKA
jgi:hypothetical protein